MDEWDWAGVPESAFSFHVRHWQNMFILTWKKETSVEFNFCLYHESWCMVQHEGLIVKEDESYTHPNKHAWHTQVVAHPSPFELQTSDCQSWIWILLKKESECMYFIKVWKRAHRGGIESKRVITRQSSMEICMHVSSRVSHLEQIFFRTVALKWFERS
jgi:hypothetical protein